MIGMPTAKANQCRRLFPGRSQRAVKILVVLDARRSAGPYHACRHRVARERPPRAGLETVGTIAAVGDHGDRLLVVVAAKHADDGEVHHLRDLLGDGPEHLVRRRATGDERRYPAERRLLLHEPRVVGAILPPPWCHNADGNPQAWP